MATAQEIDRVLAKGESTGLQSLEKPELDLLKRLYKEASGRGNRARTLRDSK